MKISEETESFNNLINHRDITDIYRTLYPITTAYTFFSNAQGAFSKTDYMFGSQIKSQSI